MLKRSILSIIVAMVFFSFPAHADDTQSPWATHGYGAVVQPLRKAVRSRRNDTRVMLAGIVGPLAAKAQEIVSACNASVISGVRHTKVAGTRHWSLHSSGRAVDMRGNPRCIYAHLAGWPGGYSTDYGRVQHVHISYGGREDGLRFAHYRPRGTHVAWRN